MSAAWAAATAVSLATCPSGPSDARATDTPLFLYVGSVFFSSGVSPALYAFRVDAARGVAAPIDRYATPPWPTFGVFAPDAPRLFVTIENDPGAVLAFDVDRASGRLRRAGAPVPSGGNGSTHIEVDRTGRTLLESHFGSGAVTALRVRDDGAPGAIADTHAWPPMMGTAGRVHSTRVHPGNRFAFAAGFWYDEIEQFVLDASTGRLLPNVIPSVPSEPGAGPRIIDVHPNGRFVYVINQGSGRGGRPAPCTVSVYTVDAASGLLTRIQDLPTGVTTGHHYHLQVAPGGRFAYASAGSSIVVLAIDEATGRLAVVDTTDTGGKTPRHFALDPGGRLLFVANLDSDTVTVFAVDGASGRLTRVERPIAVSRPTWVGAYRGG